jgi:hypothetical protein
MIRGIMFVLYFITGMSAGLAIEVINWHTNHLFGIGFIVYLLVMIMFCQFFMGDKK